MTGVADGRYELKIGSSILTRRGGTDAIAPESPQKAILRDWHVGILALTRPPASGGGYRPHTPNKSAFGLRLAPATFR